MAETAAEPSGDAGPDTLLLTGLEDMLTHLKVSIEGLLGETDIETEILHGIFVKTLVIILDKKPEDLNEFRGKVRNFLNALVRRFPAELASISEDEFMDYHREMRAKYPTDGSVVDLIRLICKDLEPSIRAMSAEFPQVMTGFVGALHFCFAFNVPRASVEAIPTLESPAIVAFSFGTGKKIGPGVEHELLTGPGFELPGCVNMGLAACIKNILEVRSMPVFAQWEVGDALIYGEEGCPTEKAKGFWDNDTEMYPWHEQFKDIDVFKATPLWPEIRREHEMTLEEIANSANVRKYGMTTSGVVSFFQSRWRKMPTVRPTSVIIVAASDILARCVSTFRAQTQIEVVLCCPLDFEPKWQDYGCSMITGYDPNSTQDWTQNRSEFIEKEIPLRFAESMSLLEQHRWYDATNMWFPDRIGKPSGTSSGEEAKVRPAREASSRPAGEASSTRQRGPVSPEVKGKFDPRER